MSRWTIVATVALLVIGTTGSVRADVQGVRDSDDSSGRLDIAAASHAHDDRRLVHKIVTHERWRGRLLEGRETNFNIWFSTDREERFAEAVADIGYRNGRLVACIAPYEEFSDGASVGPCETVEVRRPNRRTVVIEFAPRRLKRNLAEYWWAAASSYRSDAGACERTCLDEAPEGDLRGLVRHRL